MLIMAVESITQSSSTNRVKPSSVSDLQEAWLNYHAIPCAIISQRHAKNYKQRVLLDLNTN